MSGHAKLICGVILLTLPSIQYGGYFLLKILSGQSSVSLTDFQKSMFRAGHAHAGVLVIFAVLAQFLIDAINISAPGEWFLRLGFPLAAILVSGGFFAAASSKHAVKPSGLIGILYSGVGLLAVVFVFLGVLLIKSR